MMYPGGRVRVHWWKYGARWNDTYTGTWASLDPITPLNDPDRANPYLFAGDNCFNSMDPAGASYFSLNFSACYGIRLPAGVSWGDDGPHGSVGIGLGPEAGADVSVTDHTGDLETGGEAGGECSGGGATFGVDEAEGGDFGGAVGVSTASEWGCHIGTSYTW